MKNKVQAIFLQIQRWSSFSPKHQEQINQKTLPGSCITHQTIKKIVADPADHGNAQFGPPQ
jgi:hypothetical protein